MQVDEEHPFVLVPRSSRGGWITDARCQGAHILRREATMYREPYVILAPDDAKRLGLRAGAQAQVATTQGVVTVRVQTEKGIPAGIAIVPTGAPGVLRSLVATNETGGLPTHPVAGSIAPPELVNFFTVSEERGTLANVY